jgi:hypothetical protein
MATKTGLDAQLGFLAESTYGTAAGAVSRFYEFVPPETLTSVIARIPSKAIRSGARVLRSDRWAAGSETVTGDIIFETLTKGMGLLFKHSLGSVSTSGLVDSAYTHTFTPGALDGLSLTGQVGRPDLAGTIDPFTYLGLKVAKFELTGKLDEVGQLKLSLLGAHETTATGLATVSYPASQALLVYTGGTLTIGGSNVNVRSFSLSGDNMSPARPYMGSPLTAEPLETDLRPFTIVCDADFESLTAYNRYVNGTEAAMTLQFLGGLIGATSRFKILVTANVRFDGDTPTVADHGILKQPLKSMCVSPDGTSAAALSVAYVTTDATP